VGALLIWLFQTDEDLIRKTAVAVAGLELFVSALLLWNFVPQSADVQFAERAAWIPAIGMGYHLGVDGINVLFIPLTAFLTVLIMVYSWEAGKFLFKPYFMALLALEGTIVGVFASLDLILFFVFWELMLIPTYFLLKLWDRVNWVSGVSLLNLFPLPREAGFRESFAFAGELVDRGYSVLVFPEGHHTTDGRIRPFRSGIGLLANNLGIPIVPLRIKGLFELKQAGKRFARPYTVSVKIGSPVRFPQGSDPAWIAGELQKNLEEL